MSEHDFLVTLARYWPAVLDELEPEYADQFAELVRRLAAAATSQEAAEISYELRQLSHNLPLRHPVREAASSARYGSGTAVVDLAGIAAILGDLDLRIGPVEDEDADDDPEAWLRAAPSLSEQEVRAFGVAPDRADLIRLPGADRQPRLPAFQFLADGQPVPVVLTVNELLDANADPWGVADWWLGENAWLAAVPAELIGRVEDTVLVQAARAELWEE